MCLILFGLLSLCAVHFAFGLCFLIDFLFLQYGISTHRLKQNGMQTASLGHLDRYWIVWCLSAPPTHSPPSTDSILFAISIQHCLNCISNLFQALVPHKRTSIVRDSFGLTSIAFGNSTFIVVSSTIMTMFLYKVFVYLRSADHGEKDSRLHVVFSILILYSKR